MVDVLQGGQSSVLIVEWKNQPTVSSNSCAMHIDSLLGQVGVLGAGWVSRCPDFLDCVAGHLMLALQCCVSQGFGLCQAFEVGHFLNLSELASYVCTPCHFHACSPASEPTSWDAITEHQVPAWLVTVARRSFGTGLEPMNLSIHQDFFWWLKACCTHCVNELRLRGCDPLFRWWCPWPTEYFREVSH